jgi:hypothetical protein
MELDERFSRWSRKDVLITADGCIRLDVGGGRHLGTRDSKEQKGAVRSGTGSREKHNGTS